MGLFIVFCLAGFFFTDIESFDGNSISEFKELFKSPSSNGVVAQYSGGRFGDNLIAIAHGVYFALKNKCQLFYIPFTYADQLVLSDVVPVYLPEIDKQFTRKLVYPGGVDQIKDIVANTLILIPYFPESWIEYRMSHSYKSFPIDWQNPEFIKVLRALITPNKELNLIKPPKDKISVAVHLRKGGGYDKFQPGTYVGLITYKIPYDEYYINQIRVLAEHLKDCLLYVFLFTDDQDPQALVKKYQNAINNPTIEFDCRKEGNNHYSNVLEDFFSMLNFDCLIRSESSFSIMAEKLGDYVYVLYPGELNANSPIHPGLFKQKKL